MEEGERAIAQQWVLNLGVPQEVLVPLQSPLASCLAHRFPIITID